MSKHSECQYSEHGCRDCRSDGKVLQARQVLEAINLLQKRGYVVALPDELLEAFCLVAAHSTLIDEEV